MTQKTVWQARSLRHAKVFSTVGCGDSLVAGLVASSLMGETAEQMLRLGVICASATASHPGTELFNRDELDAESMNVEVVRLDL